MAATPATTSQAAPSQVQAFDPAVPDCCACHPLISTNANLTYNSTTGVLAYDADGAGSTQPTSFAIMGTAAHPATMGSDFLIVA